ncbi:hypothetical protein CY35_04G117400 [Sphagnum magellanicum]|nr:hypothetical protein CY35_04G117400 [Sphagnum magellanicum]
MSYLLFFKFQLRKLFGLLIMAHAIDTDVVQEVSRILTASDVVVELFNITYQGAFREEITLKMRYHQCKADSSECRLEEPQVDGDVEGKWSLSTTDDLKKLVSTVVESTNVKAIYVKRTPYCDVFQQFLQGLRTNHTIVSAEFCEPPGWQTIDVLDKSVVMLCHNIGLKRLILKLLPDVGREKHTGFGNALKMNHTLQILQLKFSQFSGYFLDFEELVQPLIMDENGHQANSTLTTLEVTGLSATPTTLEGAGFPAMSSVGATFARMLLKNSSIKHLNLANSVAIESDVRKLIRSLVENHSLETLNLGWCDGVRGSVFPAIMDVLLVNCTLKDIELGGTPLDREGKGLAIKEQLRKNKMYKKLHLKELEMAEPTSASVIFCGFPYAGKTTLRKSVVRSIEHKSTINKSILNPCKDFMMKKIDGGQRLIQGGKQLTHRTRGIEVHSLKSSEGIRWSIWDMGGQEEFHGFHSFMLPDLSATGNPSLFLLVCSPYVLRDEGSPSKEKLKLPIEIEKELEYWLRFIASKSRSTISFKPKVIVVLTHSDKVDGLVARAQGSVTSLKEQFAELLDVWSEPIAVAGFSTQSASNVASVIEDNIVNLLKALPPVYKVCSNVRSALKGWMVRNPKSPMMNWKTFSDLCQETDLPGLVKATAEGSMIEARRKAVATSMHNSGDVIYFEDLDFLVVDLDWFCHRVMGHLIKLSDDRSKLTTATDPDGFTSRAYLENILVDSLKSSHELGYGGCALDVTAENLVHLMLRLELCFEDTARSHGVGKLFIPTILDVGQAAGSWNWSPNNQNMNSTYFGRRLQCDDPICTFILQGFFCRLQVVLHNNFLKVDKEMRAVYKPKRDFIYVMLNGVEIVMDYNANVGTHIDVLVCSHEKSFDEALHIVHGHIIEKIRERCAAADGCQGVALVEGVIRTECVKQRMSFRERRDQAVLLEELKQAVLSHGIGYQHPWDELREGKNVILDVACESAMDLMGTREREDVVRRRLQGVDEIGGAHQDQSTVISRGWLSSSSSSSILGSYLKPRSNNQHMTIYTPSDLLTGTNRLQGEIQELDRSPQHQDKPMGELAREIQQLSTVVHDTHNLMYDTRNLTCSTHKLVKNDVLSVTRLIRDLILNSSQRQVPRIVLFAKQDASFKQKLITKLVPGMKALQLHLLCEYKGQEHIVEGQAGCQVILQDENWKKVHELVVEGLKWVFLAAEVGAHIAMGLGNMVPNPKMEYAKAVVAFGEGVLKDPPIDWAPVALESS